MPCSDRGAQTLVVTETLLVVQEADAGRRLDVFLAGSLTGRSRSQIRRWIESGHVAVGGSRRKPSYVLHAGDEILIRPVPAPPSHLVPEPIPLEVIHEDEVLVVVNKPAGLVVHPGAGNRTGTLVNALVHHFQQLSRPQSLRPGIVHRLDKDTSGLLVVAKDEATHNWLAGQFKQRSVLKEYLTLVHGRLEQEKGLIEVALGRHPTVRTKISTRSRRPRAARTEYHVLRLLTEFSYLLVKPHTGRTHQIRVHFQNLGHPVVGDTIYGRKRHEKIGDPETRLAVGGLDRLFLHASRLAFVHPVTRKTVEFTSPLPGELAELLAALE